MADTSVRCCSPLPGLTEAAPAAPPAIDPGRAALAVLGWTLAFLLASPVADAFTYRVLGLGRGTALGDAVGFFAYEVPHVLLLLVAVVFVVGVMNTWFTSARVRRLLAGRKESVGNVLAALLGVVTPFCSCSAVPLFIGFVEAGVPLGVTFSFLVSAPLVNEVALVLLLALFGWKIASLYFATGLALAILAGTVLGRLGLEHHVEPWVKERRALTVSAEDGDLAFSERLLEGAVAVRKVVGKTWPYVIAGIGVGACIHGWVPEGLLASFMGRSAWWSVPLAVLLGVPMYASTATLIPVVQSLLAKGAALGTVLAFMMAVVAMSLPEFILLRRVLRPKLLGAFIAVVATGILAVGWIFNAAL